MTEQEYIDATDLANIRAAKEILRQVLPANSKILNGYEHVKVMRILQTWEDDLHNHINVIPTEE